MLNSLENKLLFDFNNFLKIIFRCSSKKYKHFNKFTKKGLKKKRKKCIWTHELTKGASRIPSLCTARG